MNTAFIDLRDDLIIEDNINVKLKNNKCPEFQITLNGVPINALVDTGSQINAIKVVQHSNQGSYGQ